MVKKSCWKRFFRKGDPEIKWVKDNGGFVKVRPARGKPKTFKWAITIDSGRNNRTEFAKKKSTAIRKARAFIRKNKCR